MTTKRKTEPKKVSKKGTRKRDLTPEEQYLEIQKVAYFLAETDDFKKDSVEYWLEAEAKLGV